MFIELRIPGHVTRLAVFEAVSDAERVLSASGLTLSAICTELRAGRHPEPARQALAAAIERLESHGVAGAHDATLVIHG